eukprot:5639542-Karenia_brevis.AAC.1
MQTLSSTHQQQLMEMVNHLQGLQGLQQQMISHGPGLPLTPGPPMHTPQSQHPTHPHIRPRLWREEAAFHRGTQPS